MFFSSKYIHVDYIKFDNAESIWRDYQRWRETLGIIVLAEVPSNSDSNMSKALDSLGITSSFKKIWDNNKLVLNSSLLVLSESDKMEISGSFAENTHFWPIKSENIDEEQLIQDISKFVYSFFNVIVERINVEAANFADSKNEGLIITLADINVDENFTTMSNRRICRKLKSAADMLLLRGDLATADHYYEQAIENGIIANDSLWIAGAYLGRATISAIYTSQDNKLIYNEETHNLLKLCHEKISCTKITELEVEISLIFARYLKMFPFWKSSLIYVLNYMTTHDLKRLRKREKGHFYYQLANIWKDAGFMRKYSWYLVFASSHLKLKEEHKDLQIQFYYKALNSAYGVNFNNFWIPYEENIDELKHFSIEAASNQKNLRFVYKPNQGKLSKYKLVKKKQIPKNSSINPMKSEIRGYEQLSSTFHWINLQKFLLKEIYDSYTENDSENWEIVSSPKDIMTYYSDTK